MTILNQRGNYCTKVGTQMITIEEAKVIYLMRICGELGISCTTEQAICLIDKMQSTENTTYEKVTDNINPPEQSIKDEEIKKAEEDYLNCDTPMWRYFYKKYRRLLTLRNTNNKLGDENG